MVTSDVAWAVLLLSQRARDRATRGQRASQCRGLAVSMPGQPHVPQRPWLAQLC